MVNIMIQYEKESLMFLKVEFIFLFIFIGLIVILFSIIIFLIIYIKRYVKKVGEDKKVIYTLLNKNAKKNAIVFLGDSLTEFYRLDEFFSGIDVYNRGIAANTTTDVISRLEDNVLIMEPRKIFLQIGTNDLGENSNVQDVYDNIVTIIKNITSKLPKTKLYVISLYPINNKVKFMSRFITWKRKNQDIDLINQMLASFCINNDITYIDVATHLKDEDGNLKKEYTLEGLHLSYLGYLKITEIIQKYVF